MTSSSSASASQKRLKAGASWDAARQESYRQHNPDQSLLFHMVLDASPSMQGEDAKNLIRAYNMYQNWLRSHVPPMSQVELTTFSNSHMTHVATPIGMAPDLDNKRYDPRKGNGTNLYGTIMNVLKAGGRHPGQHILVVFTDGIDNQGLDDNVLAVVRPSVTGVQADGWLCVFLGAYMDALETGKAMGFPADNCLVFTSDKIPEAFKTLTDATQRYLGAPVAQRKLLTQGGFFS